MAASVRGKGHSVPSAEGAYGTDSIRREGMNERMSLDASLVPEQNSEGTTSAVLLAFGVFVLSPERRQAAATLCAAALVTPAELHDLMQFVAEGEPVAATARKYMGAIVGDAGKLRDAVEGMRSFRRGQAAMARADVPAAPVPAGPAHMPNMPRGTLSCLCVACVAARAAVADSQPAGDRACGMVRCRVDGDRRTVAEVAAEMGMAEAEVAAMLERGRALADPTPPLGQGRRKIDRDAKAEAEAARLFAAAPRAERLRLLRGAS